MLVHEYEKKSNRQLTIRGLSVVNGAQTTGAIGSVEGELSNTAKVAIRFVKVSSQQTIDNIRKYNNTQNVMEPYDFRSNDDIQRRLRDEFDRIPDVKYTGRRGGSEDVIRRPGNLLAPDTVAQALAAVHGYPDIAYNEKSKIWRDNNWYARFFNDDTTPEHIVFCYSLLRTVEEFKISLMQRKKEELTDNEKKQLGIMRTRGAHMLLVSAVAGCLEEFVQRAVPSLFDISFGTIAASKANTYWNDVVKVVIKFIAALEPALKTGLKRREDIERSIEDFRTRVSAFAEVDRSAFDKFKQKVRLRQQNRWVKIP